MAETDTGFLFSAKFSDDISMAVKPAISSVKELSANVKVLGDAFKAESAANKSFTMTLGEARTMFESGGRSLNVMRAALKDAGASALDTKLIMAQLNKELVAGRKEALGFTDAAKRGADATRGLVVTLGDAIGVVKELGMLIAEPFKALNEFGNKAQEAFAEKINTLRAYNALLGDSKKAMAEFQWAQGFAMANPFTSSEVEDVQKRMIASGMGTEQARAATAGIMDLATLKGTGVEGKKALNAGASMFAEVGEQGLSLRTMRALSQDFGLSMTRIEVELAKIVGEKTDEEGLERLRKRISKGEWSGEAGGRQGQLAVLNMVKGLVGEKNLGEFAMGGANTVEVAQSNQAEQLKNLLKTFDSEVLPGVTAYKEALKEQGMLFNSNTLAGDAMSRTLQDLSSSSFQAKTVWESFVNGFLEGFVSTWNQAAAEAGNGEEGIKTLSETMKDMGSVIGGLAGPVRDTLEFFKELSPVVTVLGTALTTLVTIVKGTVTSVVAYTTALADSVMHPTKARENFKIAGEISAEAWEEGARSIAAAAGVSGARKMLPRGDRPGVKAPEPTVADFGGGKKHKKKGGKGGVYGDFMGGDWDIAEGGSWTPGAGGAAPWGSAEASPAVAAAMAGVASADAYPSQVSASMAQPSGGKAAIVVENVEIIIEGSRMSAQEVGDAVADALRGIGRHSRNPSPARI